MLKATLVAAAAAVGVATALATMGSAGAGTTALPTLRGTVGPGFTITLKQNGKKVSRLKAGKYRLVVSDRSAAHNFEIEREPGRGTSHDITSVSFTGTKTVTVALTNGLWKFYCDPHRSMMVGSFRVGAGSTVSAATTGTTTTDDHGGHGQPEPGDDKGGKRGKG
jgi:plastocyanin